MRSGARARACVCNIGTKHVVKLRLNHVASFPPGGALRVLPVLLSLDLLLANSHAGHGVADNSVVVAAATVVAFARRCDAFPHVVGESVRDESIGVGHLHALLRVAAWRRHDLRDPGRVRDRQRAGS